MPWGRRANAAAMPIDNPEFSMRASRRSMSNIAILMLVLLCGYVGQTLIKYGLRKVGSFQFGSSKVMIDFFMACATSVHIWVGVMVVTLGFLTWMTLLSRLDLSQALPMLAFGYLPWLVIGKYFLGEAVTPMRVVGVMLIVVGVFCTAYTGRSAHLPNPHAAVPEAHGR
jgi:multidrug transporter EmrE-like cation transporter